MVCYTSSPILRFSPLLLRGTRDYELKKTYDMLEWIFEKLSRAHWPSLQTVSSP